MLADVRAELDRIEQFLMRRDDAAKDLARILAGLRGPDDNDEDLKYTNTVPIRRAAFPKLVAKANEIGSSATLIWAVGNDETPTKPSFTGCSEDISHYMDHIHDAWEAITRGQL